MRRGLLLTAAMALSACAPQASTRGGQADKSDQLTVYSATNISAFQPVIDDFQKLYPAIQVHYVELDAATVYRRFLNDLHAGKPRADLLVSSAMDLQFKLVNDSFAAAHRSNNSLRLPQWARWREEAFGITFEPAVMVYNRKLMHGRPMPRSRPELLAAIREDPTFWRGKIGTYDIARSSVGYMLAAQDARQSNQFVALAEAFENADLQTDDNTVALLDRLKRGDIAVGYNLLGSYARAYVESDGSDLAIVYPQDYTLAVARTAVLPKNAPHPKAAHIFLEYLLSARGQKILSKKSGLNASREDITGPYSSLGISAATVGPLRPITLGPGLLVYLDREKRRHMLDVWRGLTNSDAR